MATRRKKTGDDMPLDRIGGFLFEGALVAFADPQPDSPEMATLKLGYIKKLGKSYADVTYSQMDVNTPSIVKSRTVRVRRPADQLIIVDPDKLNSRIPEFEKLKMAAMLAKTY